MFYFTFNMDFYIIHIYFISKGGKPMTNNCSSLFFREILQHTYWNKISQFQLTEDIYDEWVLFAIESGEIEYKINDICGRASYGDIVFCPPKEPFFRKVIHPLTFHFIRFNIGKMNFQLENNKLTINDFNRLGSSYQYLRMLDLNNQNHHHWIIHLLSDILTLYEIESNQIGRPRDNKGKDKLIERAKNHIDHHAFDRDIRINRVAYIIGLSAVQFTRRFKTYYNITPQDYLTSLKLNKAKSLLLETNYTIDHIADLCGYNNGFYLSRIFTKKLNITPNQYRIINQI